jgi:hypothetical protein
MVTGRRTAALTLRVLGEGGNGDREGGDQCGNTG